MSTPRRTSQGVKVRSFGDAHYCGECGQLIVVSYGFGQQDCPHCGIGNRPDWSPDLPSELLRDVADHLSTTGAALGSTHMDYAAAVIYEVLAEVETNEADAHQFLYRKPLDVVRPRQEGDY